jgi:hypothetical protein
MRTGRPKVPITLSQEENEQLQSIANSRSLPFRLVKRARLILMAAEGTPNRAIAQKIEQFVTHYNRKTKPFAWTATADSILEKIKRLCQCISEKQH